MGWDNWLANAFFWVLVLALKFTFDWCAHCAVDGRQTPLCFQLPPPPPAPAHTRTLSHTHLPTHPTPGLR